MSIQRIQQTRATPMTDFPLANPMCSGGLCDKTRWTWDDMGYHGMMVPQPRQSPEILQKGTFAQVLFDPASWMEVVVNRCGDGFSLCKPMILYDFIITWIIKFRTYVSFYLLFYGSKGGEIEHPSLRKRWEWRSKPCR